MSFLKRLIGHSHPCDVRTCPVVTGRSQAQEREECECCTLASQKEPTCDQR